MIIRQFTHHEFHVMRDNLAYVFDTKIREINEYIIGRYLEEYNKWVEQHKKKSVLYRLFHRQISFEKWVAGCNVTGYTMIISKHADALQYPHLQHRYFEGNFIVSIPFAEWEVSLIKKFFAELAFTDLSSKYNLWMNWINDVLKFSPDNRITLTEESEMLNIKQIRRFTSVIIDLHSFMKESTK